MASHAVATFARNRPAMAGLVVLCALGLMAAFAPWIQHHDPAAFHLQNMFEGPSSSFWLGTDFQGRDEYSRLIHGARVSLTIGVLSQVIGVGIGLTIGLLAGLGGRRLDSILMRLTDVGYAFPDLLLLILLVSVFGSSMWMMTLAIGLVSWTTVARLVRAQTLSLRQEEFVAAARAVGANEFSIATRHLLPNLMGPVVVIATFGVPQAIFSEAALSFIGLGVALPTPTWGNLVVDSKSALEAGPHLVLFSCATVAASMMAFMLVGDGLRDAFDPQHTTRRARHAPLPVETSERSELPSLPKAA